MKSQIQKEYRIAIKQFGEILASKLLETNLKIPYQFAVFVYLFIHLVVPYGWQLVYYGF